MSRALPSSLRLFLLLVVGALCVTSARELLGALSRPDLPMMWWSARAFGLLAYVALWLSALFGVMVSAKGAGGLLDKATVAALHNRWALAALVATALHVLAVVFDPVSGVTPLAAFVPLASARLRGPITLGTMALLDMMGVAVTTELSRRLPRWMWRAVHASAFGTLLLALGHGVMTGTDTSSSTMRVFYLVSMAILVGAVVQRILLATRGASRRRAAASPQG